MGRSIVTVLMDGDPEYNDGSRGVSQSTAVCWTGIRQN